MMHVRGRRRRSFSGSSSTPRSSTKARKRLMMVWESNAPSCSVGLWMHKTSGFAMSARAMETMCFSVLLNVSVHIIWGESGASVRFSNNGPVKWQRRQILFTRSKSPSCVPLTTPKVKFSYKLPLMNMVLCGTCSTRRWDGTRKVLLVSSNRIGRIAPPIIRRSVLLPWPARPTKEMRVPCWIVKPSKPNLTSKCPLKVMPILDTWIGK
mmetsp:Transcript_49571/g.142674  ORF Transcript_49571/g.142674 Transcript_49571/m.142674 type:complete len:209 (-) Transcript_49571:1957-2583(-)